MNINDFLALPKGTAIYGLVQSKNMTVELMGNYRMKDGYEFNGDGWGENITEPVEFIYFEDAGVQKTIQENELIVYDHSAFVVPSFSNSSLNKNFKSASYLLDGRGNVGHFQPNQFVCVLFGETIVASNIYLTSTSYKYYMHSPKYERMYDLNVYTRVMLADKPVWIRLGSRIENRGQMITIDSFDLRIRNSHYA